VAARRAFGSTEAVRRAADIGGGGKLTSASVAFGGVGSI